MKETVIPQQEHGTRVDTDFTLTCATRNEALKQFLTCSQRLLDVNAWHLLCGKPTAHFEVISPQVVPVQRIAMEGDYFRIAIPGPGSLEGDGYDWVRIETIEYRVNASLDEARVSMRVRPAANPIGGHDDVAHFFDSEATSTFRVTRKGLLIIASVHGRNETANDATDTLVDNVRNTVVALGARSGMSEIQWSKLVRGIVEGES